MIKQIHFFGTSHTSGGGFEFESNFKQSFGDGTSKYITLTRGEYIKSIYEKIFPNEEYTQHNFSFPGQFQKILKEKNIDIIVHNHAKAGYGNERIYRKFFEVIRDSKFNKDEVLFIFEFSDIERKELYFKPINDFVILNYDAVDRNFYNNSIKFKKKGNDYVELKSVAKTYWSEDSDDLNKIQHHNNFFKDYIETTISAENQVYELNRNNIFLFSFLKLNNINFLITEMHDSLYKEMKKYYDFIDDSKVVYYDSTQTKYNNGFLDFVHKNELLINDESSNLYPDLHPGFTASKLISKNIFNFCIEKNFINSTKIKIEKQDFKYLKITKSVI